MFKSTKLKFALFAGIGFVSGHFEDDDESQRPRTMTNLAPSDHEEPWAQQEGLIMDNADEEEAWTKAKFLSAMNQFYEESS